MGAHAKAIEANDHVLYSQSDGHLYIDTDGSGSKAPTLIAILKNKPALFVSDFLIV
jgi:hypothetical protein